jgi:hypothetical protein
MVLRRTAMLSTLIAALVLTGEVPAPRAAAAGPYTLEKVFQAPPEEVPQAIRETLDPVALRVNAAGGALCEIWLRKALPVAPSPAHELGVGYGQIAEGTLIGVVRIDTQTFDYRQQKLKPGTYTLRYALALADGNHLGIAPLRDFVVLSPVALDASPAGITREAAFINSRKTTGTNHPSVWSLAAADEKPSPAPAIKHFDDADVWVVTFRIGLAATSGSSTLDMALVIAGHAAEAA